MPKLALPGYLGRGILTGVTAHGEPADVYFIEGRSPGSKARKFEIDETAGLVRVVRNSLISEAEFLADLSRQRTRKELVLYDAIQARPDGSITVTSGLQTNYDPRWDRSGRGLADLTGIVPGGISGRVQNGMGYNSAIREALQLWGSEPDALRTARIAAARNVDRTDRLAKVGIVIRPRVDGGFAAADELRTDDLPVSAGEFLLLGTYGMQGPPESAAAGRPPNIGSLFSYARVVNLEGVTPGQLAKEAYEALPKALAVGVTAAIRNRAKPGGFSFAKRNAAE